MGESLQHFIPCSFILKSKYWILFSLWVDILLVLCFTSARQVALLSHPLIGLGIPFAKGGLWSRQARLYRQYSTEHIVKKFRPGLTRYSRWMKVG